VIEELGNFQDEAIGQLLQELRTPLTTIKTALTLLESPSLKPGQRQRYLDMIRQECDHQNLLINGSSDLLTLGRGVDLAQVHPLSLVDVLPGAIGTYQTLAVDQGIELTYRIPEGLPTVACPEGWVNRIVSEMLQNSLKFTASGGQITVLVAVQNEQVQVEFRDNGCGIPAGDLGKIFDCFYRGRSDQNGAGLGLTVVKNLLDRCGGSIFVVSQVDTGSRFRVLLPIYAKPLEHDEQTML
jgi:two-component system, OmpR family, phosphate regulon sensor histidine kinase PhoR